MTAVVVGLIGCGYVADEHLGAIQAMSDVQDTRLADVDRGRAEALRARRGGPVARGAAALLEDPSVDLGLNLTQPAEHYEAPYVAHLEQAHVAVMEAMDDSIGAGERVALGGPVAC